jgi:hypothetical protein
MAEHIDPLIQGVLPDFHLKPRRGLQTPRACVRGVLDLMAQDTTRAQTYGIEDWSDAYADTGYTLPKAGTCILFGNWNIQTRYDAATKRLIDINDRPKRFSVIAEYAGYAIEWADQWTTCYGCNKAVRTSPDSYSWQASYVFSNDSELLCLACVDWPEYLCSIEDAPDRAVSAHCNPAEHGYRRLGDANQYENGWHPGQTDDPHGILKALHDKGERGIVFRVGETSQFYIRFEVWQRIPEDNKWR